MKIFRKKHNTFLKDIIKKAEEIDSYLIAITIKDNSKVDNDLTHYLLSHKFPKDDIKNSLDACFDSLVKNNDSKKTIQASKDIEVK